MKTHHLLLLAAGGAIAAAAVLYAPQAHASPANDFLIDIHSIGFVGPDSALLEVGYMVCTALAAGNTGGDVAETIYRNTDVTVSRNDSALFVLAAVTDLCPEMDTLQKQNGRPLL